MNPERKGSGTWFALGAVLLALFTANQLISAWQNTPERRRASLQGELEAVDAELRALKAQAIRDAADCMADAVQFGESSDIAHHCREHRVVQARIASEQAGSLRAEREAINAQLQRLPQ